ncbi:hypothetical protein HanRHA438_Chr05g0227071 [Helianthus annuus]|nr:hypothetical protein HanHA89_Chr05g0192871 [Helianthus annuus]KAJ0750457.1 hypothetical protein HanLR1_Chr05g0182181 [Helianthus annuus]KAJ0919216.1 hypothetical protein HanRHA438_Chr05g0227071 [Helianthus annuus]
MHSRQIIVLLSSIRSRKPLIPHLYRLVIKVTSNPPHSTFHSCHKHAPLNPFKCCFCNSYSGFKVT